MKDIVDAINAIVAEEAWYDFEVVELVNDRLVLNGSIDFSYGHQLEIVFSDVIYFSINKEWKSDTSKAIISVFPDDKFLQGCYRFVLVPEDLGHNFFIIAKDISFDASKVYYYKKDNLGPDERIADWVK